MAKFAIFVDLENCGAKVPTLNSILEKVKIRGDILLGKVYGYTDRFSDLKELLLSALGFPLFTAHIHFIVVQRHGVVLPILNDALL